MGGGETEFIALSGDGISSKVDLDSKWHSRLELFREIESKNKFVGLNNIRPSYSIPRIIVIGEESSGKSSTLERIAMMSFFPTDRKLCTRMPIELRLRHRTAEEIKHVLSINNKPHYESYVKMSVKRAVDSKLPVFEEYIYAPHEACEKMKEWMDQLTTTGTLTHSITYCILGCTVNI